jgi:hypothetical protein
MPDRKQRRVRFSVLVEQPGELTLGGPGRWQREGRRVRGDAARESLHPGGDAVSVRGIHLGHGAASFETQSSGRRYFGAMFITMSMVMSMI